MYGGGGAGACLCSHTHALSHNTLQTLPCALLLNITHLQTHTHTTQVLNYAHGGAAACPENSVATQIRFIRDLPAQTSAFIANISSAPQQQSQQGGGGGRRLLPINFIGNNDVRVSGWEGHMRGA